MFGSYTGVERKTNQRELKVPTWNASSECVRSVMQTLWVKMRRKASRWVYRGRRLTGVVGDGADECCEATEVLVVVGGDVGDCSSSRLVFASSSLAGSG